ncbi:MAG: glycogen synthase, partial [Myxococcota bacterium]
MKVALCTREYPPEVYGGAGVHIEHLAKALSSHIEVAVHCFGKPRTDPLVASNHQPWEALEGKGAHLAALRTFSVDLAIAASLEGASLVHTHTWYANLAGHLAKLTYGIPHVMTSHSLEPLRPWKVEQLGGGYQLSLWAERLGAENADAIIAVSKGMKEDIVSSYPGADPDKVHIIHNGIDTEVYKPVAKTDVLERFGIDPELPTASFVGRITRQKGVSHLLEAAEHFMEGSQLVLCAGEPDTKEIGE